MCISDIKEAGRLFSASLLIPGQANMSFMLRMLEETERVMEANKNLSTKIENQLRLTRNLLAKVRSLLTK